MKSAITICLVPEARSGPFVFHDGLNDGCRHARQFGFDAIEVFPSSGEAVESSGLSALLKEHELGLAAVGTGAGWLLHQWSLTSPDSEVRNAAIQFIRKIIQFAGGLGAPAILGSMQGRVAANQSREESLKWLGDGLSELSETATQCGQVLLYEPLNRYETNLFNRQAEAGDWLDQLGLDQVKILADLFHMNIEEQSLAESLRSLGGRLGHVHFADSNRRAIGMGHTKIPEIMKAIREIRYEGYLSAEIFPLPDAQAAAQQTIESFRWAISL